MLYQVGSINTNIRGDRQNQNPQTSIVSVTIFINIFSEIRRRHWQNQKSAKIDRNSYPSVEDREPLPNSSVTRPPLRDERRASILQLGSLHHAHAQPATRICTMHLDFRLHAATRQSFQRAPWIMEAGAAGRPPFKGNVRHGCRGERIA